MKISSAFHPVSTYTEAIIKAQPVLFSLIILYQGLFAGNAIEIPKNLKILFKNPLFRFLSLLLIALSATQDIEYATISTTIFVVTMFIIKTPEERKKSGII